MMLSYKKTICFLSLIIFSVISSSPYNTLALTPNQASETNQIQWSNIDILSSESSSGAFNPSTVVDSQDNMYIVWEDVTDYNGAGTDYDIFYKNYNASTQSWGNTVVISTESSLNSFYPSIAVDSENNLHVVWYDYFSNILASSRIIYYKNYNATTQTWGTTVLISSESSSDPGSLYPSISVDSEDNVHVVWQDGTDYDSSGTDSDIFYKNYNATTLTWGTTVVISTESSANSNIPSLAIDRQDNIHVVWQDITDFDTSGTDGDIFYKKYNTTTQSWGNTVVISTESSGFSNSPSIVIDIKDNLHVVWDDITDYSGAGTDTDVFYKKYNGTLQSWGNTILISSESTDNSFNPAVTVDSENNLYLVWEDVTNYIGAGADSDIFYKKFDFAVQTWTTTIVLSPTSMNSKSPTIITDSKSNLHIVWEDITDYNGAGTFSDIFHKTGILIPKTPVLKRLSSVNDQKVALDWGKVEFANKYKVYRSNEPIYNISGLSPVANVTTTNYSDTLNSTISGFYFYVVIASNLEVDSKVSNIVHVEIKPTTSEPKISGVSGTVTEIATETKTDTLTKTVTENAGQVLKELQNKDLFIPLAIGSGLVLLSIVIILRKRKKRRK